MMTEQNKSDIVIYDNGEIELNALDGNFGYFGEIRIKYLRRVIYKMADNGEIYKNGENNQKQILYQIAMFNFYEEVFVLIVKWDF